MLLTNTAPAITLPPVEALSADELAVRAIGESVALFAALSLVPAVLELGIADALADAAQSAAELAAKVHGNADAVRRILRFLASYGFFIEDAQGRFRHSPLSRLLRADHPQSQQALFRLTATPIASATLREVAYTLRTGRPATEVVAREGLFNYLSTHPYQASIYAQAMTAKSQRQITAILRAYDFAAIRSIADIGGGRGHLLQAVLKSAPGATGVLFDLPHVIDAIASPASEKLSLQAGNFFKDPLPSCELYLLCNVIHDWPDKEAIRILTAVRRAAPRGARLLLLEYPLPSGPELSLAKYSDVAMLVWTGGRERSAAHYQQLLSAAGFGLHRIIPASSDLEILEAR